MFDDSDSDSSLDDFEENTSSDEDNEMNELVSHDQWVKAIEQCSYRSKFADAISKTLSLENLCGATNESESDGWIMNNQNREETLIVSFENAVFINEIVVFESINPGSVVKLELVDVDRNQFWTMWQRKSFATHEVFKPHLRRYRIPSNTIRLTLDPRHADRIGIKAIQLRGSNQFDVSIDRVSISQAMAKLYQEAMRQMNTDIQFRFEGKTIHAHRNILCCRSSYFRALLTNDFQEKSQSTPFQLTDVDEETFQEILRFLYTGEFSANMSYDLAIKAMIYANKINLINGKNAAIEHVCCYLRVNHHAILPTYSLIKPLSPTFDLLLDYLYELSSENLNEICQEKQFRELEKGQMIDLICQSAERLQIREQKKKAREQFEPVVVGDDSSDEDS